MELFESMSRDQESTVASENLELAKSSWQNWLLMAGMSLLITIGLTTAIPPLMSQHITNVWPWVNTDLVLLTGLSLAMFVFVGYLTQKERQLATMRRRLAELQHETTERARRNYSRVLGIFNVSRMIGSKTYLQGVFDCITKTCTESFGCQRASLMEFDKKNSELVLRSESSHSNAKAIIGQRRKVGEGIAGWVAANRRPVLIRTPSDTERYPGLEFHERYSASSMVVPIIVGDSLVGVLNVSSKSPDVDYDEDDLRILWVFAENAGTCIQQTKQVDWIKESIRLSNECPHFQGQCRPPLPEAIMKVETIAGTSRQPH